MSFIAWLLDIVFPPRSTELLVRNLTTSSLAELSNSIPPRAHIVSIDQIPITYLLSYRLELVQACIIEAKYHHNQKAQQLLGNLLADHIKVWLVKSERPTNTSFLSNKIVLVPLPLSKDRRKARGYNQVERIGAFCEETLAKDLEIAAKFEISIASESLMRVRDTAPQTTLGRESRKENMKEAFLAPRTLNPAHTYILIDDVVTTGATLLAAHKALKDAGTTRIFLITLAH